MSIMDLRPDRVFTAVYRQEGKAWVVTFAELELSTWGRTLEQAKAHAREALAVTLEFDSVSELLDAAVTVVDDVQLPDDLGPVARALRADRVAHERDGVALARRTAEAVAKLSRRGMSVRDIGAALGVSPQRVSQLTSTKSAAAATAGNPREKGFGLQGRGHGAVKKATKGKRRRKVGRS